MEGGIGTRRRPKGQDYGAARCGMRKAKMNNFFEELKRRNVVRVAFAYVVVSWVLIQAADILLPTFGVPEGMLKGFYILLALGFPIALIISWAYEVTPEGVMKTEAVDKFDLHLV